MVFRDFLALEFLQSREPELGSEICVVEDVGSSFPQGHLEAHQGPD